MRTAWTFIVPARAGSQRVVGKNYQPVGGLPLICWNLDLIFKLPSDLRRDVIVTTDDPMIRSIVKARYGAGVRLHDRPAELADHTASIDDLCDRFSTLPGIHPFCVIQPTTFGLNWMELAEMLNQTAGTTDRWTMVVPRHKLDWLYPDGIEGPRYAPDRRARDEFSPAVLTEVGVRFHPSAPPKPTHYPYWPYRPLHAKPQPVIDIDTPEDLEAARLHANQLTIGFDWVEGRAVGHGHTSRCRTLMERLQHHDVVRLDQDNTIVDTWGLDVVVLDRLDTDRQDVAWFLEKNTRVVTFEDQGSGAALADAVISDMYPVGRKIRGREYVGPDYAVLRPEFLAVRPRPIQPDVERVLVTFGGTDPAHLTEKFTPLLTGDYELRVIVPPGRTLADLPAHAVIVDEPHMAYEMSAADLVVTSAGRTLYEAAACRTPAVSLSQNHREARHLHRGRAAVYMGDGREVSEKGFAISVNYLIRDVAWRQELADEAAKLVDGRGTERVAAIIEDVGRGH
jgi:spore coat polysaccharide biosynthesis predicted glycosyltransferase SpsG